VEATTLLVELGTRNDEMEVEGQEENKEKNCGPDEARGPTSLH
jgi:hypothetical protein